MRVIIGYFCAPSFTARERERTLRRRGRTKVIVATSNFTFWSPSPCLFFQLYRKLIVQKEEVLCLRNFILFLNMCCGTIKLFTLPKQYFLGIKSTTCGTQSDLSYLSKSKICSHLAVWPYLQNTEPNVLVVLYALLRRSENNLYFLLYRL